MVAPARRHGSDEYMLPDPPAFFAPAQCVTRRIVGCGGMAVVYEATCEGTAERIALKVSLSSLSDEELQRFEQEARIGRRLAHSGIPAIRGSGRFPGGAWIAMDYAEGSPLDQHLSDLSFTARQRLDLLIQVAEILDHAHSRGVVHRDVKPANVLLGPDGVNGVKLLDFGIAKLNDVHLTRPGVLVGTPSHMAPEQLTGEPIDHRTDIFQLGVLAYELFATQRPWTGEHPVRMAWAVCNESPAKLADCVWLELGIGDQALDALEASIMRTLARNRSDRHASAGALAEDLRSIQPLLEEVEEADLQFEDPVWDAVDTLVVLGPPSLSPHLPASREICSAKSAREVIARVLAAPDPRAVIDCASAGLEATEEILNALDKWKKGARVALLSDDTSPPVTQHPGLGIRVVRHDSLDELSDWLLAA